MMDYEDAKKFIIERLEDLKAERNK